MNSKKIAITGGIGSGKSLVLSILESLGYKTLSSDKIVAKLYEKRKVKKLVKTLFPTAVKGKLKLTLDKKELAKLAFSSDFQHEKLTKAITPLVMLEIDKLTKKQTGIYFVEVPLLFECGYQDLFDEIWVITRPLQDRIASVKARSNFSEEQILARIAKQVDYDKLDLSNYTVIQNVASSDQLKKLINDILKNF